MKMEELINAIDKLCESAEDADKKAKELLEKECFKVTVHAPHLDKNLHPEFLLLYGEKCPHNMEQTVCSKCPYHVCVETAGEPIFSYSVFNGYCIKDINSEEKKD